MVEGGAQFTLAKKSFYAFEIRNSALPPTYQSFFQLQCCGFKGIADYITEEQRETCKKEDKVCKNHCKIPYHVL